MPNTEEISSASRTTSLPSIIENDAPIQKSLSANNLSSANFNANTTRNESCENGKISAKSDSEKTTDDSLSFQSLSSLRSDLTDPMDLNFEFDYEPSEKDRNLVQKLLKARKELDVALRLVKSKPSSINFDQLSDITITQIAATPPAPKVLRSAIRTRKSFPTSQIDRRSSFGSSVETSSNRLSLPPKPSPRNSKLIQRESVKSSEKGLSQTKSTPLRRTASGSNLRPTINLTKGQVTKSNNAKLNNTPKKI